MDARRELEELRRLEQLEAKAQGVNTGNFLPSNGSGKTINDDIGVTPMSEQDILMSIDPQATQEAPQAMQQPIEAPMQPQRTKDQGYIPEQPSWRDYARTAFDQGMQGGTFAFADDISDRLGVAGAALMTDPKALLTGEFSDPAMIEQVANARQTTENRLEEQMREMPVTSIGANVAGAVATGGTAATTKAGATLGNALRSGNTLSRAVKAIPLAAASGALYGAGAGVDGEKTDSSQRGFVLGTAAGPAGVVLGNGVQSAVKGGGNIARGITARGADALDNAVSGLKTKSNKAYQAMADNGATLNIRAKAQLINNIEKTLQGDGLLNKGLHGKTMSVVSDLKDRVKQGDLTLEEVDQWRQLLGQVASNMTPDNLQDARKASILIDALDNTVENLGQKDLSKGTTQAIEALNLGRTEYRRMAKFRTVSEIIKKSDGDANYLKRELKKLLDNPKKSRGFSQDELDSLKEAATLSLPEGLAKMAGKFGFDLGNSRIGSGVGAAVGSVGAGSAFGGVGAVAAPVIGTAARYGQKFTARGKAEKLLQTIERGGNVSMKEVLSLPPSQARELLTYMRSVPMPGLVATEFQTP